MLRNQAIELYSTIPVQFWIQFYVSKRVFFQRNMAWYEMVNNPAHGNSFVWIETLGKVGGLNLIVMLQILARQFSKILVFPPSYNVHMIPCFHNNYKSISQNGNQIARLGHQACLQVTRVMTTEKWIWRRASVWTRFLNKKGCGAQ